MFEVVAVLAAEGEEFAAGEGAEVEFAHCVVVYCAEVI